MARLLHIAVLCAAMVFAASFAGGQEVIGGRESLFKARDDKKNPPAAKQGQQGQQGQKKPQPAKPTPATSRGGTQPNTTAKARGTSPTASRGSAAARTKSAPLANAPGSAGQVKQVTKSLAESIKTRKVDYDEEEMEERGTAIILNSRKYRATEDNAEEAKRTTSDSPLPLVRPL